MSDDTPTQRFDAPLTPSTASSPQGGDEKKSRALIIALIAIGALVLIALIIVLIALFSGKGTPTGTATPTTIVTPSSTPSSTPSATPSATPTPTHSTTPAPPPATGPTLTAFSSSTNVECNAAANPIPLNFSWTGTGATAYIAVGATDDPKQNGEGWTLPPTGTQADFPAGMEIDYPCYQQNASYTIGVYDNSGHKVVKQLVVTNNGTVK